MSGALFATSRIFTLFAAPVTRTAISTEVEDPLPLERQSFAGRWTRFLQRLRRIHDAAGWDGVRFALTTRVRFAAMRAFGRTQSDADLIADSKRYWTEGDKADIDLAKFSHWVGTGPWQDREPWLRLGRVHRRMFERLCAMTATPRPVRRIVEWGCGGGANAIHFIDEAEVFYGIDIAQPSLDECGRVLEEAGFGGFKPVLIDPASPEQALASTGGGFDFYLSAYVFELLPGKPYALRVLEVAQQLLRPGGLALIQIRYDDGSERSRQRRLDYYRHATRFTSFRVEEFWVAAEDAGFRPEYVTLVPRRTEDYSGDLYAYFALVKQGVPSSDATALPTSGT